FEAPLLELLKTMSLLFINNQATTNTTDHIVFKLNVNLLLFCLVLKARPRVKFFNNDIQQNLKIFLSL
ncbi:hypothetical protein, partial [Helicobacter cinaedi]|uniref:hypothetical protein n=1 Tax=Helicobacter cinaedi TaxID=213 RepID=UPI00105A9AF2